MFDSANNIVIQKHKTKINMDKTFVAAKTKINFKAGGQRSEE